MLLCGNIAMFDPRHPERSQVHKILHFLLKTEYLNVAKGEVTHGGWKFKSAFMDVLIWLPQRLYITTIAIQDLC